MADIAALLDVARDLTEQNKPDIELMLDLLDNIPIDGLDALTRGAIAHAQKVTAAAVNQSSAHTTVARFALFRVVVLLKPSMVVGLS